MCQMASVGKIHAQHGIPRLQHCKKYCHVCLGSGMRLNIYIFATKKLFRPVDRKLLDFIHRRKIVCPDIPLHIYLSADFPLLP